jgi:hypothetical protein
MNTTQRTIATAIAAIITGIVSLGAGLDTAAAANQPSPDIHKRPAPTVIADNHHPSPDPTKRPKPSVAAAAGHHHSPDANTPPKPTIVTMPCPAADNTPQCNLQADTATTPDASITALRSPTATGGGAATTLNIAHNTPTPR